MLKSLYEEDHNGDNFSKYCFSFYFQPARPLMKRAKLHFSFLISLSPWIDFPKATAQIPQSIFVKWKQVVAFGCSPTDFHMTATVVFDVALAVWSI